MQFHPCPCFGGQFQGVTAIILRFFGPLNPLPSRSKGLVSSDSSQFSFGGAMFLSRFLLIFGVKNALFLEINGMTSLYIPWNTYKYFSFKIAIFSPNFTAIYFKF
jgi:hypothetical protein